LSQVRNGCFKFQHDSCIVDGAVFDLDSEGLLKGKMDERLTDWQRSMFEK
jgi:hypothetical protein